MNYCINCGAYDFERALIFSGQWLCVKCFDKEEEAAADEAEEDGG